MPLLKCLHISTAYGYNCVDVIAEHYVNVINKLAPPMTIELEAFNGYAETPTLSNLLAYDVISVESSHSAFKNFQEMGK